MQERAWEKHGAGSSQDWLRPCAGRSSRHSCAPCHAPRGVQWRCYSSETAGMVAHYFAAATAELGAVAKYL